MIAQTNHHYLKYAAENKLTWWFVYEWRKPTRQKPHWVILRSPLPRIHYYQNKRLRVKESQYLIPTYSWTLIPIPNWTYSVMTSSPFQCMALSTWLTDCADLNTRLDHQLEKDVSYKVLQFIQTMKIMKLIGHKTLWCTNTATSSRIRATRFPVTLFFTLVKFALVQLVSPFMALKINLIYV